MSLAEGKVCHLCERQRRRRRGRRCVHECKKAPLINTKFLLRNDGLDRRPLASRPKFVGRENPIHARDRPRRVPLQERMRHRRHSCAKFIPLIWMPRYFLSEKGKEKSSDDLTSAMTFLVRAHMQHHLRRSQGPQSPYSFHLASHRYSPPRNTPC